MKPKSKKIIVFVGSILLCLMLVAPMMAACAEEAPAPAPTTTAPAPTTTAPAPAPTEAKVYEMSWQDCDPAGQSQWFALQNMAERVKAASGGRIEVTLYPEGEILPRNDVLPGIRDNVVQAGTYNPAMEMGIIGPVTYLLGASGLPAGPSTDECLAWLYGENGMELINEVYQDWCYIIGAASGAGELFAFSNKPLSTAADFKGLKFRTMGMWAEVLGQYGASVTTIAGAELYSSMERGVLDAFEYGPPSTNWTMGFHEVADYIGLPGIQSPGYTKPVMINKEFYDSLPADLQALLKHECQLLSLDSMNIVHYADSEAMEKYEAYGTKIFYVEDDFQADIAERCKALCDQYAADDPQFNKVWEDQQEFFRVWRALSGITPKYTIFD